MNFERVTSIIGVVCTVALSGVGIYGIIIALRTLREMQRQREEMSNQVQAALLQLGTMNGQLSEMSQQTESLKTYVEETTKIAQSTKDSADAAKVSADISARVSIPTLVVEKFELGDMGAANIRAILQFPKIQITLHNYGQTPAFLHSWSLVLTCEKLPPAPDYFGHPGSGHILDKEVIQPNVAYTLPELPSWNRQEFSPDDVEAIINRKKMLVVYGYVSYRDLFDNPLKRLKFCEFALNIGDNWIQWCDAVHPVYCGTDLYPGKSPKVVVEREPDPDNNADEGN